MKNRTKASCVVGGVLVAAAIYACSSSSNNCHRHPGPR